jgi:hypothetical protein
VARAARRKTTRLPTRRVALVASLVSAEAGGDALGDAALRGSMAGGAPLFGARRFKALQVLRVVKLRRETCQRRKFFSPRIQRAEIILVVADRANRINGGGSNTGGKLNQVTSRAVLVNWESWLR